MVLLTDFTNSTEVGGSLSSYCEVSVKLDIQGRFKGVFNF